MSVVCVGLCVRSVCVHMGVELVTGNVTLQVCSVRVCMHVCMCVCTYVAKYVWRMYNVSSCGWCGWCVSCYR